MVFYKRPTFDAYRIYAVFSNFVDMYFIAFTSVTWTSTCYNCSFLRFLISKHRSLFSGHVFAKVCPTYSFKAKFEGPSLEQKTIFKCYVLTTVLTSTDNDTSVQHVFISVQWKWVLFNIAKIKKQMYTCELCFNVVQGLLTCDHIFSFQSHLHATQ